MVGTNNAGNVISLNKGITVLNNNQSSGPLLTRGGLINQCTDSVIEKEKGNNGLLDWRILHDASIAENIRGLILDECRTNISICNNFMSKGEKYKQIEDLDHEQVAKIMKSTGEVHVVRMDDGSRVLAIKQRNNRNIGTFAYVYPGKAGECSDENSYISSIIRRLVPGCKDVFITEVIKTLIGVCDTIDEDKDSRLIYCQNGVYDARENKPAAVSALSEPFVEYDDPLFDELYGDIVRFYKLGVPFNPNAGAKVILHNDDDGTDWDIDGAVYDAFDVPEYTDEEKTLLTKGIWQVFQFGIRGINGKKAVWWSDDSGSTDGGSGKSTLASILINIVGGNDRICSVSIEQISDPFALANLPKSAIMVADESDADTVAVEKIAAYKSLVTGTPVTIRDLYRRGYSYNYGRVILQLFNNTPKIRSKGGALWSRILNFKFKKNYRTSTERTYIADDYVHRPEVLEYVLYKLVHMPMVDKYDSELIALCNRNKNDIRKQSSRVWAMMDDILDMIFEWKEVFDRIYPNGAPSRVAGETSRAFEIPIDLLYDIYREWSIRDDGRDRPMTKPQFVIELSGWVAMDKRWFITDNNYNRGCGHLPSYTYTQRDIPSTPPTVATSFVLFDRYELPRWTTMMQIDKDQARGYKCIKIFQPARGTYRGWFRWNVK